MAAIYFFDLTGHNAAGLKALAEGKFPGHQLNFRPGPVTAEVDATVISLFVSSSVTADMMAAMPQLRLIACCSTGYDNVDLAAAAERGIRVCNVPSYGENTVAEYGFGLLLSLIRKIPQAASRLKGGDTSREGLMGTDLHGKTLGLVGAGRIGCQMARIAGGFGMTVMAYDVYPDADRAAKFGFSYHTLDEVLAGADVVSLHVPGSTANRHLINAGALAKMKPSAIIVNTARGEVIDTHALIEALSAGRLAGAALDVYEGEPVDSDHQTMASVGPELAALLELPNVLVTNHNAFDTSEALERINQTTLENIASFLDGHLQNEVRS